MDTTLRQNIIDELTRFLNRSPSENEIQNAQTDTVIMSKINKKDLTSIKDKLKI